MLEVLYIYLFWVFIVETRTNNHLFDFGGTCTLYSQTINRLISLSSSVKGGGFDRKRRGGFERHFRKKCILDRSWKNNMGSRTHTVLVFFFWGNMRVSVEEAYLIKVSISFLKKKKKKKNLSIFIILIVKYMLHLILVVWMTAFYFDIYIFFGNILKFYPHTSILIIPYSYPTIPSDCKFIHMRGCSKMYP